MTLAPFAVCLDLETTDLDPNFGDIIEVAAIIVAPDLAELAHYRSAVAPGPDTAWNEWSLTHHAASGLASEAACARPLAVVMTDLDLWLGAAVGASRPYLMGCSVHFDRSWIDLHSRMFGFPNPLRHLHHKHYDVSTLLIEAEAVGDPLPPRADPPHRALADCRHALATARCLRQLRRSR